MNEIKRLERMVKWQGLGLIVLLISIAFLWIDRFSHPVITTQGIVIVDEEGNDRILIGAPIPTSKDRIRDDLKKVEAAYADWFPPEAKFMENFEKEVDNRAFGILMLDEHGYDKLALGDHVPDPFFGKRIGPSSGIVVNDSTGTERTGYGLIKMKDRYRVSLGFDRSDGYEGMILGLDDKEGAQISIQSSDFEENLRLGQNLKNNAFEILYENKKDSITQIFPNK
ncbi:hypothetical protein V8V91_24310 [Algoriphagus halophilus]|uniref:hypothetical protein n=1 Tax=Algoriphagus halophilus TaxID=226505 RepID=UPI00358EB354